ncbi:hypothetical protein AS156_35795 [Bradyrhizobium macuxiense]|uniref:Uncharacterized protein n=1 Tax=Bradyrhizobium macuxiense TaxID=1755647 RepID=A0A120FQ92_9BRAD|nr:hypothetical protein AS156_35795 [Bradyrhizobium macuxiense]
MAGLPARIRGPLPGRAKGPHARQYGRHGQKRGGIDILARRDGIHDHFVGIQCGRYDVPLTKAAILKDCRDALAIKAGPKEIMFTTCPSDTKATDAAIEVESELRAEGHDLSHVTCRRYDCQNDVFVDVNPASDACRT